MNTPTVVHTHKFGDHVLAVRSDGSVHVVLYRTTLAQAYDILSQRRDLIVH
jgi:hypothetical protein